jgi:hypothetical protein
MAHSYLEEEYFTSNDVVSSLWNKNASRRCCIGLADTLIYENGVPVRWYVTGKGGEVTKKRSVDIELISQRWLKIQEHYGSPVVAIIRQTGGVLKFLNAETWKIFISDKADSSVLSVHCFINGENHNIYRCSFRITDRGGHFVKKLTSSAFNLTNEVPDSVVTMYESKMKFAESRAAEIIKIMTAATCTVVDYTELMLQVRVLDISIDFVIDKKSQVWMLWASDRTKFVRSTSLEHVNLPEVVDAKGRASWMGERYFEDIKDRERYEQEQKKHGGRRTPGGEGASRSVSPGSRATGGAFSPTRSRVPMFSATAPVETPPTSHSAYQPHPSRDDLDVPLHVATAQVNEAVNAKATQLAKAQRKRVNENESSTAFNVFHAPTGPTDVTGPFPNPFKCKGDYCGFLVTPAGHLAFDPDHAKEHLMQKLFSAKEVEQLRKDRNFSRMMEFESSGPALAEITMRSIILARQERRGLDNVNTSQPWSSYPDSPRAKIKFRPDAPAVAHLEASGEQTKEHQVSYIAGFVHCAVAPVLCKIDFGLQWYRSF